MLDALLFSHKHSQPSKEQDKSSKIIKAIVGRETSSVLEKKYPRDQMIMGRKDLLADSVLEIMLEKTGSFENYHKFISDVCHHTKTRLFGKYPLPSACQKKDSQGMLDSNTKNTDCLIAYDHFMRSFTSAFEEAIADSVKEIKFEGTEFCFLLKAAEHICQKRLDVMLIYENGR